MKVGNKNLKYIILSYLMFSMITMFTVPLINSIKIENVRIYNKFQKHFIQNQFTHQGSLDNNVEWDYILHDSRDSNYRFPGFGSTSGNKKSGAVLIGTNVTLKIRTLIGDVDSVEIIIWKGPEQNQISISMSISNSDSEYDFWEGIVNSPTNPSDYYYHFVIKDGSDTDYYSDDDGDGGIGLMYDELDNNQDWGIVFYAASFETPEWHRNSIGYQIFPERFYNGDPTNDPIGNYTSGDIMWYAWDQNGNHIQDSYEITTHVNFKPWTDTNPGISSFYGGDLKGIEEKVDYLADLGIDFIWFNPFTESPDNHGYAVDNYTSIDPYFGKIAYRENGVVYNDYSASLQVFENMTSSLAEHGIRPLYDAVINHVSAQSVYFQRFESDFGIPDFYPDIDGAYEWPPNSYTQWFEFFNYPSDYNSWWGFDNIPTLMYEQSSGAIEEELITGEKSLFTFWQEHGIGGFRLDVPNMYVDGENSFNVNKEIRNIVKSNDPDDIIIGEIWERANAWLTGNMHDGVQNMDLRENILNWVNGLKSSDKFTNNLLYDQENYPPAAFYSQWTLLGNHDTTRALTELKEDKNLLKLAATIQLTYPGVPVIYYGDEVGLNGGSDPGCRKPFPWGSEDLDLHNFYKNLIVLRKDNSVFRKGGFEIVSNNNPSIISYARELPNVDPEVAIIIINRDESAFTTFDFSNIEQLESGDIIIDAYSNQEYTIPSSKQLSIVLQEGDATIFLKSSFSSQDNNSTTIDTTNEGTDSNPKQRIPGYNKCIIFGSFIGLVNIFLSILLKRNKNLRKNKTYHFF